VKKFPPGLHFLGRECLPERNITAVTMVMALIVPIGPEVAPSAPVPKMTVLFFRWIAGTRTIGAVRTVPVFRMGMLFSGRAIRARAIKAIRTALAPGIFPVRLFFPLTGVL
jgi:hypothetical protein